MVHVFLDVFSRPPPLLASPMPVAVSSIPVMRQPLQILFLILVTDLPPSIALGFEPGEELTMKRKPRPKEQPVVVNWMWFGIVANGMILTLCIFGTYMLALWAYAGAFLSEDITDPTRTQCAIWPGGTWGSWHPDLNLDCGTWTPCSSVNTTAMYNAGCAAWTAQPKYADAAQKVLGDAAAATAGATGAIYTPHGGAACKLCIDTSIRRARTCAFISLVWAEGFRAYVSRSFENPVWVNTFSNPSMNKAVLMAQVTLFIALYLPGLSDEVLGLYVTEIHAFGWALAAIGALACLVICELFKCYSKQFVETAELAGYEEGEDGLAITVEGADDMKKGENGNGPAVHVEMTGQNGRGCCAPDTSAPEATTLSIPDEPAPAAEGTTGVEPNGNNAE